MITAQFTPLPHYSFNPLPHYPHYPSLHYPITSIAQLQWREIQPPVELNLLMNISALINFN